MHNIEIHAVPSFFSIHDTLSYAKPVISSSLDLRSSFHSLIVDDDSIEYTAFQSHLGQFEFVKAPFGTRSVPSHLNREISLILAEKEGPLMKSAHAYVNDVLCYSGSIEKHFGHLWKNFRRFQASKIKLNAKKCSFFTSGDSFYGEPCQCTMDRARSSQSIGHIGFSCASKS